MRRGTLLPIRARCCSDLSVFRPREIHHHSHEENASDVGPCGFWPFPRLVGALALSGAPAMAADGDQTYQATLAQLNGSSASGIVTLQVQGPPLAVR